MRLLAATLVILTCGCAAMNSGLDRSEMLANYHPLLLSSTRTNGDILTQEGLEYLREGSFDKFLSHMNEALKFYSGDAAKTSDVSRYLSPISINLYHLRGTANMPTG